MNPNRSAFEGGSLFAEPASNYDAIRKYVERVGAEEALRAFDALLESPLMQVMLAELGIAKSRALFVAFSDPTQGLERISKGSVDFWRGVAVGHEIDQQFFGNVRAFLQSVALRARKGGSDVTDEDAPRERPARGRPARG